MKFTEFSLAKLKPLGIKQRLVMNISRLPWCFYALLVASIGVQGCGPEPTEETEYVPAPPVANAGSNQSVMVGTVVRLNASGSSYDSVRNISSLDYKWMISAIPDGSDATLSDANIVSPTFLSDLEGEYRFKLVVNDGTEDSTADETIVVATTDNFSPVARTAGRIYVHEGKTVRLDGSLSTDAEFGRLTYQWSTPERSVISEDSQQSEAIEEYIPEGDEILVNPRFTSSTLGNFTTELTVSDGSVDSAPEVLTIVVQKEGQATPKADAGVDQHIRTGDSFTLDATNSNHIDHKFRETLFATNHRSRLTYFWQIVDRPAGSEIEFFSSLPKPTFVADIEGVYQYSLSVGSETNSETDTDTVTISATTSSSNPVANAGRDQNVSTNALVQLDASLSSDKDNDTLSYTWNITSSPQGSTAVLDDIHNISPSFTADLSGAYVLQLISNDGLINSNVDTLVIIAAEGNSVPVAHAGEDREVSTTDDIILDARTGSSSDADDDALIYRWSLVSQPSGSNINLLNGFNYQVDSSLLNSINLYREGQYVFKLVARDENSESRPDMLLIEQLDGNDIPVAKPRTLSGETEFRYSKSVILDASNSTDGDGDTLSYRWIVTQKPLGSIATIADALASQTEFSVNTLGRYIVELEVHDGKEPGARSNAIWLDFIDTLTVDAGQRRSTFVNTPVALNAITNGTNVTYTWSVESQPPASTNITFTPNSANQNFTPNRVGLYTLKVTVEDHDLNVSLSDTVDVYANEPRDVPTDEPTDVPTDSPM